MILRSYARHISTEASISTIISDIRQSNERTMDPKTFADYMEALKDLYILEDLPVWNPNIRSKTSIRSTPTRHFIDTSIACRSLGGAVRTTLCMTWKVLDCFLKILQ